MRGLEQLRRLTVPSRKNGCERVRQSGCDCGQAMRGGGGWGWIEVLARQGAVGGHNHVKNLFGWQTMTACGAGCVFKRAAGGEEQRVCCWYMGVTEGLRGGYGWHVIKAQCSPGRLRACSFFSMNDLLLRNEGRLGCRAVESGVSCVRWTSACPAAAARGRGLHCRWGGTAAKQR